MYADPMEIFEASANGEVAAIHRRMEGYAKTGHGGPVDGVCGEAPHRRQPPLSGLEVGGQELALRPVQLQRKGEVVAPLPAIIRQKFRPGGEIGQRRGVGARRLGAHAGLEVELGDLFALRRRIHQRLRPEQVVLRRD